MGRESVFHLFVDAHLKRTVFSNNTSLSISSTLNLPPLVDLVSFSIGGEVVLKYTQNSLIPLHAVGGV